MADFFGRLAERALGVAVVAQPAIAPRFALGPRLAVESSVIEAPAEPSYPEQPRSSRSPDVEMRRAEADAETTPPARLEERIPAPLSVDSETKPEARIGDPPQSPPKITTLRDTLETKVQVTEPRGQPDIAPHFPRPELRLEASDARPEPQPARIDLEVPLDATRVEPVETVETKPVTPHPTMLPVPRREGQPSPGGRQSSHVDVPETPEPIVRVSIGRIEVRAVFPEQPQRQRAPLPRSSTLTLSEYLKQRDGGMR